MSGFFPIDRSILSSSVWANGTPEQVKVWFYLMLEADPRTGIVSDSEPGIALRCGLPLDVTVAALDYHAAPDPLSRTKDHGGARIERLPAGGFRLLNYMTKQSKDYSTPRVRSWRERKAAAKRETQGETKKRVSSLHGTKDKDKDKDKDNLESVGDKSSDLSSKKDSSSADALAKRQPDVLSWSRQACDDWIERFGGTAPGGQIGKFLKPLVKRYGWPVVRSAWRSYLAQSEAQYASPSRFSGTYGKWAGLIEDPEKPDEVMAHNERYIKGVVDRIQELGDMAGILPSMPKARR